MKLSSKKPTAKKMAFMLINKAALQQVKGGKNLQTIKDKSDVD